MAQSGADLGENMRIKQLFANLGMILALSALFLSTPTFATGEEESNLPGQSENTGNTDETEDSDSTNNTEDNSSDSSSIGGGLNADNNQPAPSKPSQPETPSVSKPLPQPEEPDVEAPQSTPSAPISKPTLPAVVLKPQVQTSKPTTTVTPVVSTPETVDDEEASITPIVPTAPNDNIAPTNIETPRTGIVNDKVTPINPLAVALLILAGVTIIAAGIVSTILSKAGQRNQSAI